MIVGPSWDPDSVAADLGFEASEISDVTYINEVWWLFYGNVMHDFQVESVSFDSGGMGGESDFLLYPDIGSFVYVQIRGVDAYIGNQYTIYHDKAAEYQWWAEIEDFLPELTSWKAKAFA